MISEANQGRTSSDHILHAREGDASVLDSLHKVGAPTQENWSQHSTGNQKKKWKESCVHERVVRGCRVVLFDVAVSVKSGLCAIAEKSAAK